MFPMNGERDPLTGLYNRVHGLAQLEHAVAKAKQGGETDAVLFTDIEHFLDLNCSLGHLAGDVVLCQLAERLQLVVADKGTLCRFDKDEFLIVLPSASAAQAREIAEGIRERLAQPLDVERHVVYVTMTIGIASYPADGQDAVSLLRAAGEAAPPTKWGRTREMNIERRVNAEDSTPYAFE